MDHGGGGELTVSTVDVHCAIACEGTTSAQIRRPSCCGCMAGGACGTAGTRSRQERTGGVRDGGGVGAGGGGNRRASRCVRTQAGARAGEDARGVDALVSAWMV
jgi:hypothetical protein